MSLANDRVFLYFALPVHVLQLSVSYNSGCYKSKVQQWLIWVHSTDGHILRLLGIWNSWFLLPFWFVWALAYFKKYCLCYFVWEKTVIWVSMLRLEGTDIAHHSTFLFMFLLPEKSQSYCGRKHLSIFVSLYAVH